MQHKKSFSLIVYLKKRIEKYFMKVFFGKKLRCETGEKKIEKNTKAEEKENVSEKGWNY